MKRRIIALPGCRSSVGTEASTSGHARGDERQAARSTRAEVTSQPHATYTPGWKPIWSTTSSSASRAGNALALLRHDTSTGREVAGIPPNANIFGLPLDNFRRAL